LARRSSCRTSSLVVVGSVGVEIVGELLPPLLESVPAAAIPAKTRIALMMMAAFVMVVTPSECVVVV
jgi:hypothetical protein